MYVTEGKPVLSTWQQQVLRLLELSKEWISTLQLGLASIVTMKLLVTERTKHIKRGFFRAHALIREKRDTVPGILLSWTMY
jgi:hypothetical protein